ncbi:MAG: protein kinase [Pyrinomonadaceae bacterium]
MAAENWQQVRKIFDGAVRQKPEGRERFVHEACASDLALLREVESLLASHDSADNFLETPAVEKVADAFSGESDKLRKDQCLRHYKIIREIGSGGMGEVYLATDTKLNRRVAIKVPHQDLLSNDQATSRLLREAQAAAMLDHPNICSIHEISETEDGSFIVMQYVEGETLADVLTKRPSIERSIDLAIQVVDALSEAHAHHIIHRDIKPANIIVNEKGQVKVLDFGLAKFVEAESSAETTKGPATSGSMMGTVPYMSPEQLRGKRLDARTDIFSFGAMFYEMLSGQQAFGKESNAETISAILNDQPDWTRIPAGLQPIVQKTLRKGRDDRYQTAQDLTRDLREAQQSGAFLLETDREASGRHPDDVISTSPFRRFFSRETAGSKIPSYRFWKSSGSSVPPALETDSFGNQQTIKSKSFRPGYAVIFAALTMFLLIGAAGWAIWQLNKADDSHAFDNLRSVKLVSWKTGASTYSGDYRISPDGKMVAYSSTQDGPPEAIFVKQTADGAEIRVTKDEWGGVNPLWSPDGQKIAFSSVRDNRSGIYSIPAFGGNATMMKIIGANNNVRPLHWSNDEATLFYESAGNLFRVDIATQETAQITNFDPVRGRMRYFSISPDEAKIVYVDQTDGQTDLWVSSIIGGSPVQLTNDKDAEILPRWHPDGQQILYTLYRNNYNQINVAYRDRRPPSQVTRSDSEYKMIDVSGDGTKIYYLSQEKKSDIWGVTAETGEEFEIDAGLEAEYWPDISPDGQAIAYQSNLALEVSFRRNPSIIVKSLTNQFPPLSVKGYNPRWLPDSHHVAFLRWQEAEQKMDFWLVNTLNSEERQITKASVSAPGYSFLPYNRTQTREYSWSPDSGKVVFVAKEAGASNILMTTLESDETVNITNNTKPNLVYSGPSWSMDDKGIAFVSQEKPAASDHKPIWKIWVVEANKPKEIYSTTAQLRLLGWPVGGDLVFEESDVPMAARPLDIKLLRISAAGQKRSETVFRNIYVTSMSLSADGKLVAFTVRQDDKDNIWLARPTGRDLRKITTNGNSRLFYGSPAISPDGKTIFFDKQEETKIISRLENFE